ncbi:MAG: hypothetical protein LBJ72_01585 [Dysgonamonadaceae bacterium]|jgi:hypothetical protein|nr:hypothetical protein [Dysgonamonadaceae bacterium]
MDLTNFKSIDKIVRLTIMLSLLFCVIIAVAFVSCFFYLSNKIDAAYTKALVIDTKGSVYEATPILSAEMRRYEYENHIKTFVNLWYAFDESNYNGNIEKALYLIGNRGKEMVSEYRDVDMYNSLIQKNIRYGIIISEINIDMSTLPVTGSITFTQMGFRAKGSSARDVYAEYSIYDVNRSRENPHGAKIEDWKVQYSQPRETTREEEKTNKSYSYD